ncbi:MAG: hypothetical protein KGD68_01495 [Candidatus Lokiarchaeota archaeon]|nr:hypothetical protein [Candidatus Lokiarchaeota archaeon]
MLKLKKVIPRTYEQICLDKLKELGKSTASEWANAMGYETHNALSKVIRRIVNDTPEKIIVVYNRKPRYYQAI